MLTGYMFPTKDSKLFRFCEMEIKAIEVMRWIESEKVKKDIGGYHAQWLWITTERDKWLKTLSPDDIP